MKEELPEYYHDKKRNMEYWDLLDDDTENYLREMLSSGHVKYIPESGEDPDFDDCMMFAVRNVQEFVFPYLKDAFGADFPYVDENY